MYDGGGGAVELPVMSTSLKSVQVHLDADSAWVWRRSGTPAFSLRVVSKWLANFRIENCTWKRLDNLEAVKVVLNAQFETRDAPCPRVWIQANIEAVSGPL